MTRSVPAAAARGVRDLAVLSTRSSRYLFRAQKADFLAERLAERIACWT
jgi:hypothetical protein